MNSISQHTTQDPENTSVFILAAGRGERMRPLTDTLPKPLLQVNGKNLLEHHLERLKIQGFKNIVINIDHLGEKVVDSIGNGDKFGLNIRYSDERPTGALETAGGIHKALPLLESEAFIVINGDVWSGFDYTKLLMVSQKLAMIVLVENPTHNPNGDFSAQLDEHHQLTAMAPKPSERTYTFSGIGLYQKALFKQLSTGKQKLAPLLYSAAKADQLGALFCEEEWFDIGTPERLDEINQLLQKNNA